MKTVRYTFWKDGDFYIGFVNDHPEHETQGFSKNELIENLKDLMKDIESEEISLDIIGNNVNLLERRHSRSA